MKGPDPEVTVAGKTHFTVINLEQDQAAEHWRESRAERGKEQKQRDIDVNNSSY